MPLVCDKCGRAIVKFGNSWVHFASKNIACANLQGLAVPKKTP